MATNPGCVRTGTTLVWRSRLLRPGRVLVLTAGTADLPVAAECVATLRGHGFDPVLVSDVGVAGVHRLLATADELAAADAVVVVAGMEGALASLVGGMTPAPVVAVPTSVGLRGVAGGGDGPAGHAGVVRVGADGGRHRQRVRRRLRRRPPAPRMRTPDEDRLVPLLRRDRRRHGPGQPGRRRRRPGRGGGPPRTAAGDGVVGGGGAGPAGGGGRDQGPRPVRGHGRGAHLRPHLGPDRRGPPAAAGAGPGPGRVRGPGRGGGTAPSAPAGAGPLPRGGRARRHRRRGRHVRRPGDSRRRPGDGQPGGDGPGHGPQRPRGDPQPGPGGAWSCCGGRPPTGGRSAWS